MAVLVAASPMALAVHAEEATPSFQLRGFGTVGTVHSSIDRGDFTASTRQSSGAGFSHHWAWGVDSKLGLQFDAKFSEQLGGVVQVVSRQRPDKTYAPQLEWANLQYRPHPDLSLRAGRILLPAYMAAESRLVGYGNPWIRPPIETYNLVELTRSDGVDVSYRAQLGGMTNTVQVLYGRQDEDFVLATPRGTVALKARVKELTGIANTLEDDAWTVRAAAFTAKAFIGNAEGRVYFYSLGAVYDPGPWFVQGEWATLDARVRVFGGNTQRRSGFYTTIGYRWNAWTPYATYSWTGPASGAPLPNTRSIQQRTLTAGLRWEVAKNAAIKAEFSRIDLGGGGGGNGYFIHIQRGFPLGGAGNVASVAIDFIF